MVEQFPKMEGRQMVMVLSPNKNPKKAKVKAVEEVLIDNAENTET